jgi:hypothetical protein
MALINKVNLMRVLKVYVFMFLLIPFMGCETVDSTYYTNPSSAGYKEQGLGGICELCGRDFRQSAYQIEQVGSISCPYDGHTQNALQAFNRYQYAVQQQQTMQSQQTFQNIQQIQRENTQKKTEIIEAYMSKRNNVRPITVMPVTAPRLGENTTTTNCNPNGYGGVKCTSY